AVLEPFDDERERAPGRARYAEVEPLLELVARVVRDREPRGGALDRQDFDVARVELRVDCYVGHSTSIVSPLLPGKSLNSAAAIFAAPSWVCARGELAETVKLARPSHTTALLAVSRIETASWVVTCSLGPPD